MSNVFIPTLRRRLSADPSTAYDPPDESVMDAPPAGMGAGPYSPPVSVPRPTGAPTLNNGAYAPPATTATSQPAAANPYLPQQNAAFQKLESAYSAPHTGTLRQVFGALVGGRNPQLGGIISGETNRNRGIENAERDYQLIANAIATNRAMQTADITNRKNVADTGKIEAETGAIPAKAALENAQAEAANYKEDPNLGLIDLRTKQPVNQNALAPLSKEEADVLGKQEGERVPLKLKNTANEIVNRGYTTVNTEEGVFEHKRGGGAADMTRLGNNPREITLDTPVGALDSTTGKQVMVTKKDIIASPGRYAPISADVSTPVLKQTLKEFASTKPNTAGGNLLAFNTAMAHLGLLHDAIEALGNGNVKLFNSLGQKYKEQTGSTVGATFDTVKQAVSGELAKVTGSLNQGEQEAIKQPLDKANSPQALRAAVRSAVQIMDGKIGALHQRYVNIIHDEPDEPLIDPEAQKVRDRLLGGSGNGSTAGGKLPSFSEWQANQTQPH